MMLKKIFSRFTILFLITLSSLAFANSDKQLEINKKTVVAFYDAVINQKNFASASTYLGSHYTQHNPTAADGPEGLRLFIEFLRTHYPNAHSNIKRVFAEGDYVILQVHSIREPGTKGRAIFDLFKLENGKIIEHWDAVQDIPEKSANKNGMF
jgi:predicted SnoaL-like aldol condensation-catalyzing enzyme